VIRWGIGDVLYGLLLYLAGGIASSIVLLATGVIDLDSASEGDIQLGVGALAVTLMAGWVGFVGWPVVATYRKGQRSLARDFGLDIRWIDVGWGVLGGVGALALSMIGSAVWIVVSGDDAAPGNGDFLPDSPGVVGGIVLFLLVAVATPIVEELFFRGLTLRAFGRRWGLPAGVVGSSIVFGLLHATGGDSFTHGLFISVVTAFYGVVFALLVVRAEGRIGPSVVAHMCVNGVAVIALLAGASV
jgi:hypothetical protein